MIPILMYHNIVESNSINISSIRQNKNQIGKDTFEDQMKLIFDNKFKTVSISQLYNKMQSRTDGNNSKYVCITFDDGYANILYNAYPILKKYKFNATIFVIVNRVDRPNYLSWDQLKLLHENGIDIHSHTLSHRPLEIQEEKDIQSELELSKKKLESRLKKKVNFISFPQGSYSLKVINMAKKVGYLGSCTSDPKFFNEQDRDFYRMARIPIFPHFNLNRFIKIINCNVKSIKKMYLLYMIKNKIKKIIGLENYLKIYTKFYKVDNSIFTKKI